MHLPLDPSYHHILSQQVHELMLEAWDGLDDSSRTEYITEAATESNNKSIKAQKKSEKAAQSQQQQRKQAGGDRFAAESMAGQKRKATALSVSCSSSSSSSSSGAMDDDYDHDIDGEGRNMSSINTPMNRLPLGAGPLSSPSHHQQSFLRSPSSSSRTDPFGQTRGNAQHGEYKDSYKPPRVSECLIRTLWCTLILCMTCCLRLFFFFAHVILHTSPLSPKQTPRLFHTKLPRLATTSKPPTCLSVLLPLPRHNGHFRTRPWLRKKRRRKRK